jgi:hypothetical protein
LDSIALELDRVQNTAASKDSETYTRPQVQSLKYHLATPTLLDYLKSGDISRYRQASRMASDFVATMADLVRSYSDAK